MAVQKLGELLIADGLLTAAQVEQALRAQVMWGGRLGTNIVELGFLDLDALSRALGRQHQLPAALARHFERGDRELQRLLSPEFAERFICVPLMKIQNDDKSVVVAVASPLVGKPLAIVADELAIEPKQIIQSVVAELRLRYHLERVYQIPRGIRFLRSRGPTVPAFPQFQEAPPALEESAPDHAIPVAHEAGESLTMPVVQQTIVSAPPAPEPPESMVIPIIEVEPDPEPEPEPVFSSSNPGLSSLDDLPPQDSGPHELPTAPKAAEQAGRDRRQYVRTLGDMVDPDAVAPDHKALGRIAIRRVAVNAEPNAQGSTFPEATRAIRRATDRDRIAELAMAAIDRYAPTCDAAMLLVVRGEVAIGWKGFVRNAPPPPEFAVPLDRPGLCVVARKNTTARCSAGDLDQIDCLLLEALGRTDGDLVVVPIGIAGQVVCMIATATAPDAPVAAVEAVAAAAGAALSRLMHAASR